MAVLFQNFPPNCVAPQSIEFVCEKVKFPENIHFILAHGVTPPTAALGQSANLKYECDAQSCTDRRARRAAGKTMMSKQTRRCRQTFVINISAGCRQTHTHCH